MDPQPQHPSEASIQGEGSSPVAVTNTEPGSTRRRLDSPLQAIFGAVIVLLLGFALTQTNDRISRLEDRVDTGFARIDERFTQIDERFSAQDERLHEINLKLTALIAALNATAEVEAALDGRLLDPFTPSDEPES